MTDRHVLLTRPKGENESLAARLDAAGLKVLLAPMISLDPVNPGTAQKQLAMNLDQIDRMVFVSKSAVHYTMPLLDQYWPQWPAALAWYAVGSGTAALLAEYGLKAHFPAQAGSEGLLALIPKKLNRERVLIARGVGGRELLATELRSRGAEVEYLETYQRRPLPLDNPDALPPGTTVVVTSGEILENFAAQVRGREAEFHLVAASSRIGATASNLGFASLVIAAGAGEQALYDAIMKVQ